VKEVEENPGEAAAIVGKHILSMPRQLGDNAVEASGKYTYIISLFQLQRKTNYQQK
jgi:hypothetical protein